MSFKVKIKRFLASKGVKVSVKPKLTHTSKFQEEEIIADLLGMIGSHERYVVDIAAADGLWMSNTYSLYAKGYRGLAVEYNAERFAKLADWYQFFDDVKLMRCKALPHTILEMLETAECPKEFGVLNLDIDSYDYYILERLLTQYRPQVMCIEINERIPWPIQFTVDYDASHYWKEDHFFGQSLGMLHPLMIQNGYDLVNVHYNNAFYVPKERNRLPILEPGEAFKKGYLEMADRKTHFYTNGPVEHLYDLSPSDAMGWLRNEFDKNYAGKYTLRLPS